MRHALQRRALVAILVTLGATLAGCGQSATETACIDTVVALTDALERCSLVTGSRDAAEREVEEAVTMNMGCGRVVSIRDERELRDTCFPALETVACTELSSGSLPASCRAQIEVRAR